MLVATQPTRESILADRLKHFLRTIVSAIARSTQSPEILHYPNEALFTLVVDGKDQGRFIGKHGSTIWSIQTLFWFAGLAQFGYSYSVKLLEPEVPSRDRRPMPIKFTPKWERKILNNLISEIIGACIPAHADYEIIETDATNAIVTLKLQKYLQLQLDNPCFPEAVAQVLFAAGMSQGASIKTETQFI
jgi:predicted RNA-binding protein YlqC (UPF0109 family)